MADAATPITAITTTPQQISGRVVSHCFRVFNAEPLAASTSVESIAASTSYGLRIGDMAFFGLWVRVNHATSTSYTVRLLQSYNDSSSHYAVPDTAVLVPGSTSGSTFGDANPHIIGVTPVPMPLIRVQVINNTTASSGTVDAVVWAQG